MMYRDVLRLESIQMVTMFLFCTVIIPDQVATPYVPRRLPADINAGAKKSSALQD